MLSEYANTAWVSSGNSSLCGWGPYIKSIVCRFGVPRQIHTDQGRQFESGLFKELCKKFSIDKTLLRDF
jgi:transposase InsO family protein